MALIISILISLGIVTSASEVNQEIIDSNQTEINEFIIIQDQEMM